MELEECLNMTTKEIEKMREQTRKGTKTKKKTKRREASLKPATWEGEWNINDWPESLGHPKPLGLVGKNGGLQETQGTW